MNNNNKLCEFCDGALNRKGNYYVCENCKTVAFIECCAPEKRCQKIREYLDDCQDKLKKHQEVLHDIEQQYILKRHLSETEQKIHNLCSKFQDIKDNLLCTISNHTKRNCKCFRKNLYNLLEIIEQSDLEKEQISEYFKDRED